MRLFRVFDWDGHSLDASFGGPLFVHRSRQGAGRHDIPEQSGVWYLSQSPIAAVAETLQYLRGHTLTADDFVRRGGMHKALAAVDLHARTPLVDLDDPRVLEQRQWRPSGVATLHRHTTQSIARVIFDSGSVGFCWWSVLEASWINATLFHERALLLASLAGPPRPLSSSLDEVREAADYLGIQLA